jgi:hypothetical protein
MILDAAVEAYWKNRKAEFNAEYLSSQNARNELRMLVRATHASRG